MNTTTLEKSTVNTFDAVLIAEGSIMATKEDYFTSWSHLIKSGLCWSLNGWFGRRAKDYIESGCIDRDGTIHWEVIDGHA